MLEHSIIIVIVTIVVILCCLMQRVRATCSARSARIVSRLRGSVFVNITWPEGSATRAQTDAILDRTVAPVHETNAPFYCNVAVYSL